MSRMPAPEPLPLDGLDVAPEAAEELRGGHRWAASLAAGDSVAIHSGGAGAPIVDTIAAPAGYIRTTRDLRLQLLDWLNWNRDDLELIHDGAARWWA